MPPTAFIGQPTFIGAEFVNVGKVALNNFIVMLEGNFHKEQASYFVGNLQIGASDYYQGIVYPEKEGTLSGKLVFSYIDNNNREVQVEEPFQLEVLGARAMEPMPGICLGDDGSRKGRRGPLKDFLLRYTNRYSGCHSHLPLEKEKKSKWKTRSYWMRKLDIISMANKTSGGKARTILTCLGVVIGTASIVVMISLGIGLKVVWKRAWHSGAASISFASTRGCRPRG